MVVEPSFVGSTSPPLDRYLARCIDDPFLLALVIEAVEVLEQAVSSFFTNIFTPQQTLKLFLLLSVCFFQVGFIRLFFAPAWIRFFGSTCSFDFLGFLFWSLPCLFFKF
uniref:Uncharacterized protein n=1 Tax=Cacopsylla melanoneura TaxID=428564 RepID=A0A8D8LAW5_9HEMI